MLRNGETIDIVCHTIGIVRALSSKTGAVDLWVWRCSMFFSADEYRRDTRHAAIALFLHSVYTVKDDIVAKHKCNHCYEKLLVDVLQLIRYFGCSGFNGESSLYSGSLP